MNIDDEDLKAINQIYSLSSAIMLRQLKQEKNQKELQGHFYSPKMIYLCGHPLYGVAEAKISSLTNIDNTTKTNNNTDFGETKEENVSPRFSDGSFRIKNEKTGLMEYRFILGGRVESVYGYSDKECWQLRTEAIAGKRKKAKHSKPIMTVSDWIWQFYKLFRESGLSEQCKTEQVKHIERINANIGSSPLKNLNTEDVQKFTNSLSATSNTRKKIYGFLRSALDKAVRLGHLKRNPCDEVLVPKHKAASYPVLQLAQQRLLLENINEPKYTALFMFCCCTGLRIGEALNAEIDTANDVVYVVDEDTATKKHQRQIPLLSNRLTGLDLIAGIKKSAAQTYFKRLFKRLGIRAVVHSFRVTFISCCSYVGINPKQIQAWAGHRNFETTMNTYAKVIRKDGTTPILDYLRELKTLVCD